LTGKKLLVARFLFTLGLSRLDVRRELLIMQKCKETALGKFCDIYVSAIGVLEGLLTHV